MSDGEKPDGAMTEARKEGGKSEQPTKPKTPPKPTTPVKPATEAKRETRDHERTKRAEDLLRQSEQELAGTRFFVEEDYWEQLYRDMVRLREALGIDDDVFCRGITRQLYQVTASEPNSDKADFNFLLSVLNGLKPVDKVHAMLAVNVAVSQLALMRVAESLLRPVRFELPPELILACHHARYDLARLDKQKIKIDDQPAREWGARMYNKLSLTLHMHLQAFLRYRTTVQPSKQPQHVMQETPSMNGAATTPGVLNGKHAHP